MKRSVIYLIPIYALILLGILFAGLFGGKTIMVMSQKQLNHERHCFIIDAGHGGIDGGAVSCTGAIESHINLDIALRLNDLLRMLGYQTNMIRTNDISIYTAGDTIASKKASDLKERVRIVNETDRAILLSIHQNFFTDSYYSGGQIFYAKTVGSDVFAKSLQDAWIKTLNPNSHRQAKPAEGIYLMKNIQSTGVLIECGFLSNYQEEALLRSKEYQKKICCVIASVCANFLSNTDIT